MEAESTMQILSLLDNKNLSDNVYISLWYSMWSATRFVPKIINYTSIKNNFKKMKMVAKYYNL